MNSNQELEQSVSSKKGLYTTIWRWHFYAGLYVVPFLLMLALTGIVMLFSPQIESLVYSDKLFVNPAGTALPAEVQLQTVRQRYPIFKIQNYRPGASPDRSSEVTVGTEAAAHSVFVDPYSGRVLGDVPVSQRPMSVAELIHGTLLIGTVGDRLIEIAAGFGIVLVLSGIYLWWPRDGSLLQSLTFGLGRSGRIFWRDLHSSIGATVTAGLLFYLISGLTWSGVWGEKYVQAWSTFPRSEVASGPHHAELNTEGGSKEVPWNLEQTPMPESHVHPTPAAEPVTIDRAISIAQREGIGAQFVVSLPQDETGVWTVAATTMNKGARDPRKELTVHIDQYSGAVLEKIGWQDYGLPARAMAVSVPLHQGNFGWWNQIMSTAFIVCFLLLAFSGVRMWWLRRPAVAFHLGAPSRAIDPHLPFVVILVMSTISLAFPLTGIVIITVMLLDFFLVQRVPGLRKVLG